MSKLTPEKKADRKQAIFDSMSPRSQKWVLKKVGYEQWDPFQEPKDPIDIRKDKSKRTTQQLIREFLYTIPADEYNNSYSQGALEMALGIINNEDKSMGGYHFSIWYKELLKREGLDD